MSYCAMPIGFKVHSNVVALSPMVKVLHSSWHRCDLNALFDGGQHSNNNQYRRAFFKEVTSQEFDCIKCFSSCHCLQPLKKAVISC